MDVLLLQLALFFAFSTSLVLAPKTFPNMAWPFISFLLSVVTIELAWLWLLVQVVLVVLAVVFGLTQSLAGLAAIILIVATWPVLIWQMILSARTKDTVEDALVVGLGEGYLQEIPEEQRSNIRQGAPFSSWSKPFSFNNANVELIKDIKYRQGGIRNTLDIYRPKKLPSAGCPVLLQIHGGAWVAGSKNEQGRPLMNYLAERGWICVAINYRLSPSVGYPTHVHDCKEALHWIRTHAGDYGMDSSFVAVTGGSAGGHLAAMMGLSANNPDMQPEHVDTSMDVQAVVPLFGVFDYLTRFKQNRGTNASRHFLEDSVMHMPREGNEDKWDSYSPISYIDESVPPTAVFHGDNDTLVDFNESRVFVEKLREKSENPVVFAALKGAEHGFEMAHSVRTEYVVNAIHAFLEWCLARHRAKA